MARILIPSDDVDFVIRLAKAYEQAGHEVVVGKLNFFVHGARFDVVHYLWPEEFCGWVPPSESALKQIREALDWWVKNADTIMTVNNLFPHGHEGDARFTKLYEMFYERSGAIVHHSNISRDLVLEHFPAAGKKPNLIANQISYFDLARDGVDRSKVRSKLGIAENETVVLVFGAIRMWAEVELVMQAYQRARIQGKRLLVVARYQELMPMSLWRKRFFRMRWQWWLKRIGAVWVNEYVPDEELHRYFAAADIVVIPRVKDLSSGLVGIGMTFGKTLVAPNHGAFPEYMAGTENVLYQSGDAAAFAAAMEKAAALDRQKIGEHNRKVAETWTWARLVQTCLDAVKAGNEKKAAGK